MSRASSTPGSTQDIGPAGQTTLATEGDEPPACAAGTYDELDYPDPIAHGQGVEVVINDHTDDREDSAYKRLWRAWREHVGEPDNEPYVLLEDVHERVDWLHDDFPAHLVLKSKGWKVGERAGDDGVEGQRYEYSLQVARYDPEADVADPAAAIDDGLRTPVSFQSWIQPQNEALVHKDGNPLICQYGEGTKFRTQTTYAEADEALVRTIQIVTLAMAALDRESPAWETMNRDSWRVWKGEVHHRIPSEMMSAVVSRLRSMRTLIEFGGSGDADGGGRYRNGAAVEERVVSDMFDRIGFAGFAAREGYKLGLKVYRVAGTPRDSRLAEPKLEAFFAGTDDGTKLPHVDEWLALRATLRQLVNTVAIRSGIEHYRLQPDDYYQPDEREMIETVVPTGWRQAMQEANEERERRILKTCYSSLTKARWDVLWVVATQDGATYDQLVEATGYSRDYVREIVREFEEEDVLRRTTYPRLVVFHNEELRLNSREKLQEVHPDRDLQDIREAAEERREQRREQQAQADEDSEAPDGNDDRDQAASDEQADRDRWVRVDQLVYSAADIGRYLERGDIDATDAKIRVDGYDWIG
ncbi:hypothetical protein HLRTI_001511 [Halorhabdus tiamatea SARL4B]|uniref:Uncharacterized protein n=1 Tax=Halorhabdus tiamatea SARL4B TaxID=1033806 RepID=F7PFL2_9EURY|nr:MarR family transcriptional regulator [Halorhabdus tiamatea]ERJ06432.1 hypothetical protein HLRTI_001511 [Halorhabdus tiamatea SARL4B]CCQ34328.1 hypothetical protein HTIA_2216 [Halorhabdus tiamatea SARL4B]